VYFTLKMLYRGRNSACFDLKAARLDSLAHSAKHKVLRHVFGYEDFRPNQEAVVDAMIAGQHVLAVMPTGAGKSLCYQVPALARDGMAIVVSPLVALMQDQVAALKLAGVQAETINSSLEREANVEIWKRVAAGDVKILYMAPERLMTERMISALQRLDVTLIAVDEVHCMSQWGASFRPEYDALQGLRTAFPNVPIGAFTATADEVTRRDIATKLFGGNVKEYVSGFDRPNIRLTVKPKNNTTKQLLDFLNDRKTESGIVYCLSRRSVEETALMLQGKGYAAVAYHAGLSAAARTDAQDRFMTESGIIVVATIAFGMGIDKPDVRFVFHADLPGTLDAYYQEIGRAGRDGAEADAFMLFGLQDIRMRRQFVDQEGGGQERARREHKRLDALVSFCETPDCRRQTLLGYFGEYADPCGNCDVCLDPADRIDGTPEAKLIFAAIHATGDRFGSVHVVDILVGKLSDKAVQLGHHQSSAFGSGKHRSRGDWQSLIRQLVGAGFLTLDVAGFGGISVSKKGLGLQQGESAFRYRPDLVRGAKKAARRAALPPAADPRATSLLVNLKALRLTLAKQRGVAAYLIFSDRTLIDMANRVPLTKWDFGEVSGVGASKLEQFGEVFLNEIKRFVKTNSTE
jgi:ATP-dependent DNA helicase RecQ